MQGLFLSLKELAGERKPLDGIKAANRFHKLKARDLVLLPVLPVAENEIVVALEIKERENRLWEVPHWRQVDVVGLKRADERRPHALRAFELYRAAAAVARLLYEREPHSDLALVVLPRLRVERIKRLGDDFGRHALSVVLDAKDNRSVFFENFDNNLLGAGLDRICRDICYDI